MFLWATKKMSGLLAVFFAWQRILSLRLYCVAPLQHGPLPPVTYDFWLVGKDCCRASSPGFNCGSAQHQHSNGLTARRWLSCDIGPWDVRLMEDLTNYKLAVKQVGDSTALTEFSRRRKLLMASWLRIRSSFTMRRKRRLESWCFRDVARTRQSW